MGGSVIYGWGMRNGSVEDIERIILLVSKNRHVVGVFIPTNPSLNSLLIPDTNITILISTSIKEFLQHQVHRVTRPAQPTSTSWKPQFPLLFSAPKKSVQGLLGGDALPLLPASLLLERECCCSPANIFPMGHTVNAAFTAISTLVAASAAISVVITLAFMPGSGPFTSLGPGPWQLRCCKWFCAREPG